MPKYVWAFLAAAISLVTLDGLWFGWLAAGLYGSQMGPLLVRTPVWPAAILLLLIEALALTVFVVWPTRARSLTAALGRGALFGLATHAMYDLGNLAATTGWPPTLAFIDIGWGVALSTCTAAVAHRVIARFGHPGIFFIRRRG